MSVRNRCIIEVFGGVWRFFFCVVVLHFGFFCGCRGFCLGTDFPLLLTVNYSTGNITMRRQNTCALLHMMTMTKKNDRDPGGDVICSIVWLGMHVLKTIFIITVSNSWIFTYRDKWNRHGKIVNTCWSCLWNISWKRACLLFYCLHWIRDCSAGANIIRSFGDVGSIYISLNVGKYKF